MNDNTVAIVVVAIVFGSVFGIVIVSKLIGLIKAWINRNKNSYDEEKFERLAKAFIRHKKESEQRIKELEKKFIESGTKTTTSTKRMHTENRIHQPIEIDDEKGKKKQKQAGKNGGLKNMLREER